MITPAERMFDGAAELGRMIAAKRATDRQATKDARNAQRRSRYAATKHLPKPATTTVSPGDEWGNEDDWEASCTCYRSAPCHHCTTSDDQ